MPGDLPKGTRALLVGGLIVGAAILVLVVATADRPSAPSSPSAPPDPDRDAEAASPSPEAGLLAGPGFVPRNLDPSVGPVLHLGLVGPGGAGRLCAIGGGADDAGSLWTARCRSASAAELELPPRGGVTEARPFGDGRYHIGGAGELVVARGEGTVTVTPMPAEPDAIHVCEAGATRVVAVDGNLIHGVRQTAVAFVGPTGASAANLVETHVYDYHLACEADAARLTWLEAAVDGDQPMLIVQQITCSRGGCDAAESRLPRPGTDAVVGSIGGRVLLVYAGPDGTGMRLAPTSELASAPELDVPPDGGAPVLSRTLHARGDAAVVTLRTGPGLRALRIDSRGVVTALPVTEHGTAPLP